MRPDQWRRSEAFFGVDAIDNGRVEARNLVAKAGPLDAPSFATTADHVARSRRTYVKALESPD